MKIVGICHTASASIPPQPRRAMSSSVLERRVPVMQMLASALSSRPANRSPAASRSTAILASSAGGSRSDGSSLSSDRLIGAGSRPTMSACRAAILSMRGPPAPISRGGRP